MRKRIKQLDALFMRSSDAEMIIVEALTALQDEDFMVLENKRIQQLERTIKERNDDMAKAKLYLFIGAIIKRKEYVYFQHSASVSKVHFDISKMSGN